MRLFKSFAIATALLATTAPVQAQNAPHGIAAVVNSYIVTIHDLRQRVLFMIATTGSETDEASVTRLQNQALRNLVDEHLQMQEAGTYDVTIGDEEVNASVGRLLSRNGADPNQLVSDLATAGDSIETLRDQAPEDWQHRPYFMTQNYLFPANFVQVMTDHVYIHTIIPTGPGTCTFNCTMLISESPKTEKAERYWQKNYDLIRVVFNEDFVIGEGIQKGLEAGANTHFIFGSYECGLHHGKKAFDDALEGKLKA